MIIICLIGLQAARFINRWYMALPNATTVAHAERRNRIS